MTWKLWLDDQMDDPNCPDRHAPVGYIGAKSTKQAVAFVTLFGLPGFIDFDHDLGGDDTAMDFLKWLSYAYPDGPVPAYRVHSANPIGAANIESYINSWARSLKL